jgi:hypothetical protein
MNKKLTVHNGLKCLAFFVSFASCTAGVASVMCGCRLRGNLPLSPPYIAPVHDISGIFDIPACCEPIAAALTFAFSRHGPRPSFCRIKFIT